MTPASQRRLPPAPVMPVLHRARGWRRTSEDSQFARETRTHFAAFEARRKEKEARMIDEGWLIGVAS